MMAFKVAVKAKQNISILFCGLVSDSSIRPTGWRLNAVADLNDYAINRPTRILMMI